MTEDVPPDCVIAVPDGLQMMQLRIVGDDGEFTIPAPAFSASVQFTNAGDGALGLLLKTLLPDPVALPLKTQFTTVGAAALLYIAPPFADAAFPVNVQLRIVGPPVAR